MKTFFCLVLAAAIFPLLTLAQPPPSGTPDSQTGIEGTVTISPVHGGPTRAGVSDTMPLAHTAFEVRQGDRVIGSFQTDEQGRFRQNLAPGHYTIARKGQKTAIGFYGPFEVVVCRGRMTAVNWKCDSGIR